MIPEIEYYKLASKDLKKLREMIYEMEMKMTKSQNTKNEQLTEQWKKGELPEGYYYCKLILNNMKPSVERCKAHCIPMGVSADKGEEVLAPVPSYEEWKALNGNMDSVMQTNQALCKKLAELKELLKEVKDYLPEYETSMDILAKIDEALK